MKQKVDPESAVEVVITAIALFVINLLIAGWWMMITIGVVHAELLTLVRPVGYSVSILLAALASGVGTLLRVDK